MDLRGEPIDVCPCGCFVWNLKVTWENGELAMFFYDMECAECGSIATAPQFI
jgi:NAD-dependent dihydropyrimidine dehydrogenase PreA subunit